MVTAADVKDLALVPVRGTVYVVKLPFVLVWMLLGYVCTLLYSIVAKIVSGPVRLVKRVSRRVQLTWNWTKNSARAALPWSSYSGTERSLAVRSREELEDYQFYDSHLGYEVGRALRSRRGRKSRRKAIISSLIKILLDPVSPADSEDEPEIVEEEDEDGKVYKLIRDLVQFSRSRPNSSLALQSSGQVLDIETLRRHARDREKLQNLISELDQYVRDMDGEKVMEPSEHGGARDDEDQEVFTPDLTVSDTDMFMDASEGEDMHVSGDESGGEVYGEEFDDAHSTLSVSRLQCRGLSPVAEVSPEAGSIGSMESLNRNCVDLESELNTALSRLSTLTDELTEVEVSVSESTQAETVTLVPVPAAKGEESRKNSAESSYEDAEDDFPSIPMTSPMLGIEAGHSKRNLATARKARPPSLPKGNHQQQVLANDGVRDKGGQICSLAGEDSREFEDRSSDCSCEEDEGVYKGRKVHKIPPGAVQVLPPSLSDQLQLLTPSSRQHASAHFALSPDQTTADLYSTVNKKSPRSRSEGGESEEVAPPGSERHRSQSDSLPAAKSLFMHDLTPPWKQMRSHNSSASTDSSAATPSHTTEQLSSRTESPPPLPRRCYTPPDQSHISQQRNITPPDSRKSESLGLYDRLPKVLPPPPIPSRAGEEGLYDIIPGHAKQQHQYLHEKLALASKDQVCSTPPVSWTPQLPPRNAKLRRSGSAEVMGSVVQDHDKQRLTRHGSERRSSSSLTHEYRERSDSSSSSKRVRSSSTEKDREKRTKHDHSSSGDHHHHHHHHHGRSSERSSSEKHRSASGRSSSDKHKSSSGRSMSEKQRSSSEKHRSSEKKPSPPSKPSEGSSSFMWRILSGTASSKKSSSPDQGGREEKENRREEKKERDRDRKHSSSRSRESKGSSGSSGRTHHTVSRRDDNPIPRNESSSSLKSGVSMHSTDSSGRDSLV